MITYVVDSVTPLVDEVLVIVDTDSARRELTQVLDPSVEIFLDEYDSKSPVIGSSTGFKHAKYPCSLLLACDTPLISIEVISLLLDLAENYTAVIPRWPNGYIEPLQAAYNVKKTSAASLEAIAEGALRMRDIVVRLQNILYLSTNAISKFDPKLHTFFNVNTPSDLARAERVLRTRYSHETAS